MKANELRIGNFIFYANGDICKVSYHQIRYLIITTEKVNYSPIPLTEEWLLKFGFEKSNVVDKYYTINNQFAISTADDKFRFIKGNFVCQLVLSELQYVHQLQNLYFALTNEELTIKQS